MQVKTIGRSLFPTIPNGPGIRGLVLKPGILARDEPALLRRGSLVNVVRAMRIPLSALARSDKQSGSKIYPVQVRKYFADNRLPETCRIRAGSSPLEVIVGRHAARNAFDLLPFADVLKGSTQKEWALKWYVLQRIHTPNEEGRMVAMTFLSLPKVSGSERVGFVMQHAVRLFPQDMKGRGELLAGAAELFFPYTSSGTRSAIKGLEVILSPEQFDFIVESAQGIKWKDGAQLAAFWQGVAAQWTSRLGIESSERQGLTLFRVVVLGLSSLSVSDRIDADALGKAAQLLKVEFRDTRRILDEVTREQATGRPLGI